MNAPARIARDDIAELGALITDTDPARLIDWRRSPMWSAVLAMSDGEIGAAARAADRALAAEIEAAPGKAWADAAAHAGRRSILRALKIDPAEPTADFATLPFRVVETQEDERWIAGAIGCQRIHDFEQWLPVDVRDVVLWNPRTGSLRMLGDAGPCLVTPDNPGDRLTIYSDGFGFFRAWADSRSEFVARYLAAREHMAFIPTEPSDNCLPGALAIGELDKLPWRSIDAAVIVAGPGVDRDRLNRAIFRAARIPRVEGMAA